MSTEESPTFESLVNPVGCYAGIGSRLTPVAILDLIEAIAEALAVRGMTLRSGAAPGADAAFEYGCDRASGKKEIFLPWKNFNRSFSPFFPPPKEAEELASYFHPNWQACFRSARLLHARNCQQVLGKNLDSPIDFLIFYARERKGFVEGGTATAVFIARRMGIPTFNLFDNSTREDWTAWAKAGES